ncbi:hypothetical protein AB4298_20565 [Shewanella sp. 10N.261.52.F9]|uniref:hypothetical protein n=1 Tax=Shewanella sp. 10N.261.52.F9 TaxID=3229684 RepID=UPI00354DA29C
MSYKVQDQQMVSITNIKELTPYLEVLGPVEYVGDMSLGIVFGQDFFVYKIEFSPQVFGYQFMMTFECPSNYYDLTLVNDWNKRSPYSKLFIDQYGTAYESYMLEYFMPIHDDIREFKVIDSLLLWENAVIKFFEIINKSKGCKL